MPVISRIKSVTPLQGRVLLVTFANDVQKTYDCQEILRLDRFRLLTHEAFFNAVQVDAGGYGVSWDDERDLSEYELWTNGVEVEKLTNTLSDTEVEVRVVSQQH